MHIEVLHIPINNKREQNQKLPTEWAVLGHQLLWLLTNSYWLLSTEWLLVGVPGLVVPCMVHVSTFWLLRVHPQVGHTMWCGNHCSHMISWKFLSSQPREFVGPKVFSSVDSHSLCHQHQHQHQLHQQWQLKMTQWSQWWQQHQQQQQWQLGLKPQVLCFSFLEHANLCKRGCKMQHWHLVGNTHVEVQEGCLQTRAHANALLHTSATGLVLSKAS